MLRRYLNDKDMFERFYKQHLARRLLAGRAAGDPHEAHMLQRLKTECGYQFTSKLESMFTDMNTSADTMAAFRRHCADAGVDLPVEVAVQARHALPSFNALMFAKLLTKCFLALWRPFWRHCAGNGMNLPVEVPVQARQ